MKSRVVEQKFITAPRGKKNGHDKKKMYGMLSLIRPG